jgi:hypothetical protein
MCSWQSFEAYLAVLITYAAVSEPHLLPCRLIFTLRDFPTTEDFVYLRRFKRWPADCNPYALEVVQFADIDQANYYTMSVRGITHYIDGVNAEFASRSKARHAGLCFISSKNSMLFMLLVPAHAMQSLSLMCLPLLRW